MTIKIYLDDTTKNIDSTLSKYRDVSSSAKEAFLRDFDAGYFGASKQREPTAVRSVIEAMIIFTSAIALFPISTAVSVSCKIHDAVDKIRENHIEKRQFKHSGFFSHSRNREDAYATMYPTHKRDPHEHCLKEMKLSR